MNSTALSPNRRPAAPIAARCTLHPRGWVLPPATLFAGGKDHPGLNADMKFPKPVYFTEPSTSDGHP